MQWVRLDVDFFDHPRTGALTTTAQLGYLEALAWCGKHETGWVIPEGIARDLAASTTIAQLVKSGCWEPVEGGWHIRDAEDYQPDAEYMALLRAKRAAAGRTGGLASAKAKAEAKAKQVLEQMVEQSSSKIQAPLPIPTVSTSSHSRGSPQPVDDDGENKRLWKIAKTQLLERRAKPGLPPIVNEEAWLVEAMSRLLQNPPPPEPRSTISWFKGCEPNHANT